MMCIQGQEQYPFIIPFNLYPVSSPHQSSTSIEFLLSIRSLNLIIISEPNHKQTFMKFKQSCSFDSKSCVLLLSFSIFVFLATLEIVHFSQNYSDITDKLVPPISITPNPQQNSNSFSQFIQPVKKVQQIKTTKKDDFLSAINERKIEKMKTQGSLPKNITINDMKKAYDRLKVQTYNLENQGKGFHEIQPFLVNIGKYDSTFNGIDLKAHGIYNYIQVGSPYDFTNISKIVNFTELKQAMKSSIAYETLQFSFRQQLEDFPSQLRQITPNQQQNILNRVAALRDEDLNFAFQLAKNPYNEVNKQIQYHYYHKKHRIGDFSKETPICVFSAGYKIYSKNKYSQFFISMERQNYTNFHIVYVDDKSPDNSAYNIFAYLNSTNSRLTNRIKIVHNLQHLGALGNMYFWIQKYCGSQDIVIIVDADDSVMGHQTFQVLNAVYQNPDHWYIYSNYVHYFSQQNKYDRGYASFPFVGRISQYRIVEKNWATSHLRSFRKKVMDAIPIDQVIEYRYNQTTGIAYPYIYTFAPDRFQVYSCLELAGDDRLVYIRDFLYFYDGDVGVTNQCYRKHEEMDEYRSRIKTQLKRLDRFGAEAQYVENYAVPPKLLESLRKVSLGYLQCKATNPK